MKKKISCLIMALFLIVSLTPNTYAQDDTNNVNITLDKAVEMALKNSNSIKQIDYDIERQEEVRKSALDGISYIPSGASEPQVAANWTGLIAKDLNLQMTKKNKEVKRDTITLSVFKKYTEVLSAAQKLELAKLELEKAKKDWRITLISYDTGIISRYQLRLAESKYKTTNTSYELAQKALDKAYQNLNSLLGLKLGDKPTLSEQIDYAVIDIENLDTEIARIMDGTPTIWLAEQQISLAEMQLDLYNWADSTREPYETKKIDIKKAELSAAEGKEQLKQGLYSLYNSIMQLEDNYVLTEQALKIAQEDYKLKKVQYDVGVISQQVYLSAELALAKAEDDFYSITYQHEYLKQSFYKPWAQS